MFKKEKDVNFIKKNILEDYDPLKGEKIFFHFICNDIFLFNYLKRPLRPQGTMKECLYDLKLLLLFI